MSDEEHKGGRKSGAKSKKIKQEEEKEKRSKKSAKNVIHNTQQCADFKLKEDKIWTQLAGSASLIEPKSTEPSCARTGKLEPAVSTTASTRQAMWPAH